MAATYGWSLKELGHSSHLYSARTTLFPQLYVPLQYSQLLTYFTTF